AGFGIRRRRRWCGAKARDKHGQCEDERRFEHIDKCGDGRQEGRCQMKSIVYRLRYGRPLVLVSGLPRSGTSMLMQMLEKGGMPIVTDKIRTADEDNPKGYHEFERIKEIDKPGDKSWLKEYRGQVIKTISFLLQDLPLDLNYQVLFMRRNIEEVLRSQNKMLERNGTGGLLVADQKMRQNYEFHLKKVYYRLEHTPNFQVLYLDYPAV